jgi:hypothetical protein
MVGMKTRLWLVSMVAVGLLGPVGCGSQQLGGGPQQARDGGGPGDDAGCGPLGKIACAPQIPGCTTESPTAPVCVNGVWTCPPDAVYSTTCEPVCDTSLPFGCTCDNITGAITCRDAGISCPASASDGSVTACVADCNDDVALVSMTCTGGVWSCPPGTMDLRACQRDAAADARNAGHGG